jgi:hypothetical protein
MNSSLRSQIQHTLPEGVVLRVLIDDAEFTAFVVICEPDLERVSQIVPRSHFEQGGDIHVAQIDTADDAGDTIADVTFNMNPGDSVVFMCADAQAYAQALAELGQT